MVTLVPLVAARLVASNQCHPAHMLIRDDLGTQVPIALHGHAVHDVIS